MINQWEDKIQLDSFQTDLLVDIKNQDIDLITCTICRNVFSRPVSCDTCQNHFCSSCIANWLKMAHDNNCPTCQNYREGRPYPILMNMLSKLKFQCKHSQKGCQAIMSYDGIANHLQYDCEYELNRCISDGCQQMLRKSQMSEHLEKQCLHIRIECEMCKQRLKKLEKEDHLKVCTEFEVECEKCGVTLKRKDIEWHRGNSCQEETKICDCGEEVLRKFVKEHQKICRLYFVDCIGCKEVIHNDLYQAHQSLCEQFPKVCQICDQTFLPVTIHSLQNCMQNVKMNFSKEILRLNAENIALQKQINKLQMSKNIGCSSGNSIQNFIRFNTTTLDKDIGISVEGDCAIVRKAKNRRRDRYVLIDTLENLNSKPFEFKCKFTCINSNLVAIGICEETVIYKTVDATGPMNLMYLISAEGTQYSHHSVQENNQRKDFNIQAEQVLHFRYLPNARKIIIKNESNDKQVDIDIDLDFILNNKFYPCVCLRTSYDQIQLINEQKDEIGKFKIQEEEQFMIRETIPYQSFNHFDNNVLIKSNSDPTSQPSSIINSNNNNSIIMNNNTNNNTIFSNEINSSTSSNNCTFPNLNLFSLIRQNDEN